MHRFFVSADSISNNLVLINKEQSRHIEKVLRLKPGDIFVVFDGRGHEYQVELKERRHDRLAAVIIGEQTGINEPSLHLTLVQGIAKGEKMDSIVQKAVELGVSTIIPLESEHGVVRLDEEKASKKTKRWQKIAQEACKQCRRNTVPVVRMPLDFARLGLEIGNRPVIMLYENERSRGLKEIIRENHKRFKEEGVFLMIGPEGGFSQAELAKAREQGFFTAGLGPRILRTETAGLVACSIVLYEYDELG